METYIDTTIRPKIQGDGGEVIFHSLEDGVLTLVFQGECSKCLILERCTAWIAQEIEKDMGKRVQVRAIRKKPFFWDI